MNSPTTATTELDLWLTRLALYSLGANVEADLAGCDQRACHDCNSARGRHGPTALCRTHTQDQALHAALHAAYARLAAGIGADPWQDPRWRSALRTQQPVAGQARRPCAAAPDPQGGRGSAVPIHP